MHTKKNKACIFAIRGSCRLRDNTSLVFKIYWSDIVNSQSFTVYICPIFLWQNGWFSTFSSYGVLKYFDYSGSWSHPWPKGIHDSSPVTGLNPLVPACWISDALNHFFPIHFENKSFCQGAISRPVATAPTFIVEWVWAPKNTSSPTRANVNIKSDNIWAHGGGNVRLAHGSVMQFVWRAKSWYLSDSDVCELANLVVFVRRRTQFLYWTGSLGFMQTTLTHDSRVSFAWIG